MGCDATSVDWFVVMGGQRQSALMLGREGDFAVVWMVALVGQLSVLTGWLWGATTALLEALIL